MRIMFGGFVEWGLLLFEGHVLWDIIRAIRLPQILKILDLYILVAPCFSIHFFFAGAILIDVTNIIFK